MELYKIPQGKMAVAHSDKEMSIGYVELEPKQELSKHNRPVSEELLQISGTSTIVLFDEEHSEDITLNAGDKLEIPANKFHIHANRGADSSITLWKFNGDITDIIDTIREKFGD